MDYKHKVVLVTGSSSGIGAHLAVEFARAGASVVVNYNQNRTGAEKTAEAVRTLGGECLVIQSDVGNASSVKAMFEKIGGQFGKLDCLVNNAGVTTKKPFLEYSEEEFSKLFDSNFKSVFLCTQSAVLLMSPGSSILNISSIHAARATANFEIYGALKAGMEGLTRNTAQALATKGIRVNALRLGWVQVERDTLDPESEVYKHFAQRLPANRGGEVSDIAPMALLLCSKDAAFITGAIIPVDGGHEIMLNTPNPGSIA